VGAGVRWAAVGLRASEAGLAPLSGSSRDVGIAGYSLGGGLGWLGRKHGLQANALTAVEIVTADGELRRIDHDNETDLFWAVRGGGGNYGVVTALEFDLFPAPEIYAGALFFPYERGGEVFQAWHEYVSAGLPDELTTWAKLLRFPPIEDIPEPFRGKEFTVIQSAYLGNEADGAELIRPLTDLGPEMNTFAMVEPAALGHLAMDPEDPVPYTSRGRIISDVSDAGMEAVVDATVDSPAIVMTEIRALGGALGRRAPGAGVRATLDGDYLMFALGAVFDPGAYDEVHAQAERVEAAAAPWDAGIHYANFEEDKADARRFYDEESWRLLRALRSEWDPNNVFLANHEIKDS
jgi:FAD/FMN-containing dehydrogenase